MTIGNRIKSFLLASASAKDPRPRIEQYGFSGVELLNISSLGSDRGNLVLVKATHENMGKILCLIRFCHVLTDALYHDTMARRYSIEAVRRSPGNDLLPNLPLHVFIFHALVHPSLLAVDEIPHREDVHLIKYQEDDDLFVQRRIVLDENLANLKPVIDGMGIPVYDIAEKHRGATDKSILLYAVSSSMEDVLITRDKEFASIARKNGCSVLELTPEESRIDNEGNLRKLVHKLRANLEEWGFDLVPIHVTTMTTEELKSFLRPIQQILVKRLNLMLHEGVTNFRIPNEELTSVQLKLLRWLEREGGIVITSDQEDDQPLTWHISMNLEHPSWHDIILVFSDQLSIGGSPRELQLIELLLKNEGKISLESFIYKGLITLEDQQCIRLTRLGELVGILLKKEQDAEVLRATEMESKSVLRTHHVREPKKVSASSQDVKTANHVSLAKKDRRALMETLLNLMLKYKNGSVPIDKLRQHWTKKRSPRKLDQLISELRKERVIIKNGQHLRPSEKAYRLDYCLDLLILHEVKKKYPIHVIDLKQRLIDKGMIAQEFDAVIEALKKKRLIKDEKGFLSPHSLVKGKSEIHFRLFSYVISHPHHVRTREEIVEYGTNKFGLTDVEVLSLVKELIEDSVFEEKKVNDDDGIKTIIARGPNATEFARQLTAYKNGNG